MPTKPNQSGQQPYDPKTGEYLSKEGATEKVDKYKEAYEEVKGGGYRAGYRHGKRMSVRGGQAYRLGVFPKSQWDKKTLIGGILQTAEEEQVKLKFSVEDLEKIPIDELKNNFLMYSEWHHSSALANEVDFYTINMDKVEEADAQSLAQMAEKGSASLAAKVAKYKEKKAKREAAQLEHAYISWEEFDMKKGKKERKYAFAEVKHDVATLRGGKQKRSFVVEKVMPTKEEFDKIQTMPQDEWHYAVLGGLEEYRAKRAKQEKRQQKKKAEMEERIKERAIHIRQMAAKEVEQEYPIFEKEYGKVVADAMKQSFENNEDKMVRYKNGRETKVSIKDNGVERIFLVQKPQGKDGQYRAREVK